jgi:CheY-like chemotaxis protein
LKLGEVERAKKKKTILIVDDMKPMREFLIVSLRKVGYEVRAVSTRYEALKYAFDKNPLDLILLDINMPGMDGYEVLSKRRESEVTKHIPIIFLTAEGQKENIQEGIEAGVNDYVVKPFRFADLHRRIEKLIGEKKR